MEEGAKGDVPRVNWIKCSKMGCGDSCTAPQIYKKPLPWTFVYLTCIEWGGGTRVCHGVLAYALSAVGPGD